MSKSLKGKNIAFLATDGFEQIEFTRPWQDIKNAGATVHLVSLGSKKIDGYNHLKKADSFHVDTFIEEASVDHYDGLVLPGGVANPDALRLDKDAVGFVKGFFSKHKPVAAICHAPWLVIEAGAAKGRTLTSWPSLKTDIQNAGGKWVDQQVCEDKGLVTSRNPDDLDAFCDKVLEVFAAA